MGLRLGGKDWGDLQLCGEEVWLGGEDAASGGTEKGRWRGLRLRLDEVGIG